MNDYRHSVVYKFGENCFLVLRDNELNEELLPAPACTDAELATMLICASNEQINYQIFCRVYQQQIVQALLGKGNALAQLRGEIANLECDVAYWRSQAEQRSAFETSQAELGL